MYQQVSYDDGKKRGYIASGYLEGVAPNNPPPLVADPTVKVSIDPALTSGIPAGKGYVAQDLNINTNLDTLKNGKIEPGSSPNILTNLCAAFVSAYVTGQPVDKLLSDWVKNPTTQDNAISKLSNNQAMNITDIKSMLNMYGCKYYPQDNPRLEEPFQVDIGANPNPVVITPAKIQEYVNLGYKLILGVGVDQSGTINAGQVVLWWLLGSSVRVFEAKCIKLRLRALSRHDFIVFFDSKTLLSVA